MINSDLKRLLQLSTDANQIFVLGGYPVHIRNFKNKITESLDHADLIIISDNLRHDKTIQLLDRIRHSCTILFLNYNYSTYIKHMNSYFQNNITKFTISKQLLSANKKDREHSLIAISHPSNESENIIKRPPNKIAIFLVLKSGGIYDYRYVNATAQNIKNNCTMPHEIICITDTPQKITQVDKIVPFRHNWDKWWGKIELFRDDLTDAQECIFFDLDTVCVGNIDFLWTITDDFVYGLRDFYKLDVFQTGLMRWIPSEQTNYIYNKFVDLQLYEKYKPRGDHEYMGNVIKKKHYLQDKFPGKIVSYKNSLKNLIENKITPNIICFHGEPKPHSVKHSFITEHWKY